MKSALQKKKNAQYLGCARDRRLSFVVKHRTPYIKVQMVLGQRGLRAMITKGDSNIPRLFI